MSAASNRPSLNALHQHFLELLPKIELHGRIFFRYLQCEQRREDLIQEMRAIAWKWFVRLVERERDVNDFVVTFCRLLARAVKSGRRLAGMERAKDVMSSLAQQRHDFIVQALPSYDSAVLDNPAM